MKNHFILVLDNSGSMSSLRQQVIKNANEVIKKIREESNKHNQSATISLITFGNKSKIQFVEQQLPITITQNHYRISGMTALLDAVHDAINLGQSFQDAQDNNTSFVVMVLTDGYENMSSITSTQLLKEIKTVHKTDRWTIAFQVPDKKSFEYINQTLNIPTDNINIWDVSEQGIQLAQEATSGGITKYLEARSLGKTSVSNFYAQTDLTKVNTKKLKELYDLTNQFNTYIVNDNVTVIKPFVETVTKQTYVKGNTYYQLIKREKVQPTKDVVIYDKKSKKLFGGDKARTMIGIPSNVYCLVDPGNHTHFEIFVKSTSVNRKLYMGTKVLVRK